MSLISATMTSGFPARDLMAALNTQLTGAGYTFVESYSTPQSAAWSHMVFGGGQFVALASASATAATSPDGVTWTQRTLPVNATWNSVAYGNGLYVAVSSYAPLAATSTDGITWTLRSLPASNSNNITYVTYGAGLFVVIAQGLNTYWTSPDGITWTQRYLPASLTWSQPAYLNGLFVLPGASTAQCYTSTDGLAWIPRTLPSSNTWTSVAYGAGLYAMVAGGTQVATSPDGITWTGRAVTTGNWNAVTYGNGLFVAVAASTANTALATSPDGLTWTTTGRAMPVPASWQTVAYGAGVFAAVAANSPTAAAGSSADGITWATRAMTGATSNAIADVYRSPAAGNSFGQDWYLILRRPSDTSASLFYQVAEQYSAVTHRAANYGGLGQAVVPTAGTFTNPMGPSAPETICAANASVTLPTSVGFMYWSSVTPDRIVLGIKTVTEQGFYAGLYDDVLPSGVTQFPLACAGMPAGVAASSSIAGGGVLLTGGFTREPAQTAAGTANFEARIHNSGYSGAAHLSNYTPTTTQFALYGNVGAASRVMLGSARNPGNANVGDALRGLLIGCVQSSTLSVAGDTLSTGGKTYVRVFGYSGTTGVFVDQAL